MNEFFSDIRIQQTLAILLFSFMVAMFILGLVLRKYRYFDRKKKDGPSVSYAAGNLIMIVSGIIGGASFLAIIFSLLTD